MGKKSAGLLMYRCLDGPIEVLLAHPGGPFWSKKDLGSWSIPKGEQGDTEDPLAAAKREFHEETGFSVAEPVIFLGEIRQPSGKIVAAWAFEGDCNPSELISNTFQLEWPPKSGKTAAFPEVDRVAWFNLPEARQRILKGQKAFVDLLEAKVGANRPSEE